MLWEEEAVLCFLLIVVRMKTFCIIMALAGSCLWAQEISPAAPKSETSRGEATPAVPDSSASSSSESGVGLDTYLDAGNKVATAMKELTDILSRVDSRESADTVCEEVGKAARKLLEANREAESLPAPSDELQAELVHKLTQSGFINTAQLFLQTLMNLASHECFESEALQETLKVLEEAETAS